MNFLKDKILFFKIILILSLYLPGAENDVAEAARRIDFGIRMEDYKWSEYADDNSKILEESGQLFGFYGEIEWIRPVIGWRSGINGFAGNVDYDGRTWTDVPVKTDVFYLGSRLYVDMLLPPGCRLAYGICLKPFVGMGGEFWLRDLADTRTGSGDLVSGAEEWWGCVYGRTGGVLEYCFSEKKLIFAEAAVKLPVYTRNEANFFDSGSPRAGLEPKQYISAFGNIGFRWRQWGMKILYESLRFDRSATLSSGYYNLYQPKSKSDAYSVAIFWSKWF